MTCNNCNCQCNEEKYYQEWAPTTQYSVGDFFRIEKEVFKVVENIGCGLCEFDYDYYDSMCRDSICGGPREYVASVVFILYDTLDENEYES